MSERLRCSCPLRIHRGADACGRYAAEIWADTRLRGLCASCADGQHVPCLRTYPALGLLGVGSCRDCGWDRSLHVATAW
jgi:hypothetical protein